jgi:hypothetical protein
LTVKRFTPTITPVELEPLIVPLNGIDLPVPGTGIFTVFGRVPVKACPVIPVIACVPFITACGCVPVSGMPLPPVGAGAASAGVIVPVNAIPPANAGLAIDRANAAIITAKACLFTLLHILITPFLFVFKFEVEKNIKQYRFFLVRIEPLEVAFKRMIRLKRYGFFDKAADEIINTKFG